MALNPALTTDQILQVLSQTHQATAIYTTEDLIIQSANDAMLGFWGKNKSIIGKPLEEGVPELRNQPFKGMLQYVLSSGITDSGIIPATTSIDGELQTNYYEYEYRAIRDSHGEVYCILHTASNVTERENNRIELEKIRTVEEMQSRMLEQSERNLRLVIMQAPVAIAIFRGSNYTVEIANRRALELWGRTEVEVMNKPILAAMPELETQGVKDLLDQVYLDGKTFTAVERPVKLLRNEQLTTTFVNFVYEPLYDLQGEIDGLITIGTDVTEQFLVRKRIEESEERFRSMAEGVDVLIAVSNERGKTTFLNKPWSVLTGKNISTLLETGWLDLIHPEDKAIYLDKRERLLENRTSYTAEFRMLTQNGEYRWLFEKGSPRCLPNAAFAGYITSSVDITERKMDEIRKNDFIGMVSHELKTPLTSLTGYVQLLLADAKKKNDHFGTDALAKVNTQLGKMKILINGFLNISRLDSGKIQLDKRNFELDQLLLEMINDTKVTSNHQITFANDCTVVINADRDKIGSVILNLLSNAINYSPAEQEITVKCEKLAGEARISVKDEGIGMSPADLDKLFNRYYPIENILKNNISGFGINLYLSAEIVIRHGGKIWATSEQGKGATFYFTIPD